MDIDVNRLPSHIAIIMDGNGRWANKQGLPRQLGHRKGSDTLLKTIKYANELGIKYLTVFALDRKSVV